VVQRDLQLVLGQQQAQFSKREGLHAWILEILCARPSILPSTNGYDRRSRQYLNQLSCDPTMYRAIDGDTSIGHPVQATRTWDEQKFTKLVKLSMIQAVHGQG
jgi:hypothetical protein